MNVVLATLGVELRRALRGHTLSTGTLLACIAAGGFFYGTVMGSFGAGFDQRILMSLFSGVKVPMLLLVCFLMTLPIFIVLNSLLGLRSDLADVVRAILASQAAFAIILAALAPYTALWYASSVDYAAAQLFNFAMFIVASAAGQAVLRKHYRQLVARDPRHGQLMWAWLLLYSFVAVQMAWVLRPFVGDPHGTVQFFRNEPLSDNAYMVILRLIGQELK